MPQKWSSSPARVICLPSYRYSGPMKPTTVLTSSGEKRARHGVGARLAGLLVDAVMRVGRERAALPGLEVHHVVADRAAPAATAPPRAPRRSSASETPKLRLAASVPAIDWKTRSTGAPRSIARSAGGDVGQHAGLGRDVVAVADRRPAWRSSVHGGVHAVGGRVDADHRVAAAVAAGRRARWRRCRAGRRSGGWAAAAPTAGRAGRWCCGTRVTTRHLRGHRDQVLVAHELADRGHHLRREAGRAARPASARRRVGEQPVRGSRPPSGAATGAKAAGVVAVDDEPRDLVLLVGDQRLGQEARAAAGRPAPSAPPPAPRR